MAIARPARYQPINRDSPPWRITLVILGAGEMAMSDEERQALLEKLQASVQEARRMTRDQARARLEDEQLREKREFAEGSWARG